MVERPIILQLRHLDHLTMEAMLVKCRTTICGRASLSTYYLLGVFVVEDGGEALGVV